MRYQRIKLEFGELLVDFRAKEPCVTVKECIALKSDRGGLLCASCGGRLARHNLLLCDTCLLPVHEIGRDCGKFTFSENNIEYYRCTACQEDPD